MQDPWSASRFLFACLSASEEAPGAIRRELSRADFRWPEVIPLGSEHFILPALYVRLRQLELLDQLPSEVAQALEGLYELNLQRNELIIAVLADLVGILNQVGIEPVALKGTAYLIAGVYADPGERILADIDLLVAYQAIPAAVEALRGDGFHLINPDEVPSHHYVLVEPHSGVVLELHFQLGSHIDEQILRSAEMLGFSHPVSFRGATIRIPNAEHLLAHHCIHCQLHHGVQRRVLPLLRDFMDLLRLNQRFGSEEAWDATARHFRRGRRLSVLEAHVYDAERMVGFNVPNTIHAGALTRIRLLHRKVVRRHRWLLYLDPSLIFDPIFRNQLERSVRYKRSRAIAVLKRTLTTR